MRIIDRIMKRKDKKSEDYSYGRVSTIPQQMETISAQQTKTYDLLQRLSSERDMIKAIEMLIDETPDGKMAYNTYLRLANQGFKVVWKDAATGKVTKEYDDEFREFCSTLGPNNSGGFDAFLDELHGSSIARGGMAVEVVVSKKLDDIQVVVIDPATFTEFKYIESEDRYAIYQGQGADKVDLYDGNFFWAPFQPKPGSPKGTLKFLPAVTASTEYLQLINDSLQVISRLGFPRYDIEIDRKAFMESLADKSESGIKNSFEQLFNQIISNVRRLKFNKDFVHFDEVKMNTIGGGVNGAGIDVRAWFQALDPGQCNSYGLTPVMLGRLSSGSYSLGTVEFKIITDTVDSMRRDSKRITEKVSGMWARVKGYNIIPTVELAPIDWQKEKDKLEAELMKMQFYRRAEEYGWLSQDESAMATVGKEKADNADSKGRYEYLRASGSAGESQEEQQAPDDPNESQEPEEPEESGDKKNPKKGGGKNEK